MSYDWDEEAFAAEMKRDAAEWVQGKMDAFRADKAKWQAWELAKKEKEDVHDR